jgi:chromate transporter
MPYIKREATKMVYLTLFWSFFKVGLFSFGGGYAMIPLIEKEIVDVHNWLPTNEFLDIIAISQLTPGPIAVNAATFVGQKVAGFLGSVVATVGVTAPSFIIILTIAVLLKRYRSLPTVDAFFEGVRPAVIALIVKAAYSVARSSFSGVRDFVIALIIFIGLYKFKTNPLLVIAIAAILGLLLY